ncbi:MAG TPA: hypothetical protein VFZ66_27820 [Herpetosiphonaceae bacterium]
MPYTHQEELNARGQSRQLGIFTTANAAGAGVLGLVVWQLTRMLGVTGDFWDARFWVQAALVLAGAALGVAVTFRWSGLSLLDRLLLWIGFQQRRLARHTRLRPQAAVVGDADGGMPAVYRDGEVLLRPYRPEEDADA